jgi:ParB/Sulfiredoxin domain
MTADLETRTVSIRRLKPYPNNPRRGDISALKQSLQKNGQYKPIVVNRRTMEVLAGNQTLRAAQELGWARLAVTFVDCDEEQARRIVLADNRTADLASYETEALVDLLQEVSDLEGTGYDQDALDQLLDELAPAPLLDDEVPPLPPKPRTRPGDLYQLGPHRLLCGDARDHSAYKRLLGDSGADILWTDPPYGVSYEGKTKAKLRIENDGVADLEALLRKSFARIDAALRDGAPIYVAHPGGPRSLSSAPPS